MKKLRFILIFGLFFIISCQSTKQSIKRDDDTLFDPNSGYLLIGVETNRSLKAIEIDGPESIALSHKDLEHGSNFILVPLESGEYVIDKIDLSRYVYLSLDDEEEHWSFEVSAGTVNYVGHLEVVAGFAQSNLELVNRSTEALEFMESSFPNILETRDLNYGGPGEDNFFDLLKRYDN